MIITIHTAQAQGRAEASCAEPMPSEVARVRRIARHFSAHLGLQRDESPRCNAPWTSAVIETDGSVRPCFFHRPIGNLHQMSFEEAINGADALAFRSALDIPSNLTCNRCVCSLNYRS